MKKQGTIRRREIWTEGGKTDQRKTTSGIKRDCGERIKDESGNGLNERLTGGGREEEEKEGM